MEIIKRNDAQKNIITWDYGESVNKLKSLIVSWRNISIDILDELYFVRKVLSSQGARNDLTEKNHGWENYLDEVGLNKTTVNRWLKKYDPEKKEIINSNTSTVESVLLPKELEGSTETKLETEHKCPHCGYEW